MSPDALLPALAHQESSQTSFVDSCNMELPHFIHLMQEITFKETPNTGPREPARASHTMPKF
eukprot:1216433-Amphidinium_carterae.1